MTWRWSSGVKNEENEKLAAWSVPNPHITLARTTPRDSRPSDMNPPIRCVKCTLPYTPGTKRWLNAPYLTGTYNLTFAADFPYCFLFLFGEDTTTNTRVETCPRSRHFRNRLMHHRSPAGSGARHFSGPLMVIEQAGRAVRLQNAPAPGRGQYRGRPVKCRNRERRIRGQGWSAGARLRSRGRSARDSDGTSRPGETRAPGRRIGRPDAGIPESVSTGAARGPCR